TSRLAFRCDPIWGCYRLVLRAPGAVSPTIDSPRYIPESDLEEDPKEDDEDTKEDLAYYPTDREDDDDEEEVSHLVKAETRGITSWISSQHNGVNNRESLYV
nr:hypothetical protein [Tanacetum cinerariifolium]